MSLSISAGKVRAGVNRTTKSQHKDFFCKEPTPQTPNWKLQKASSRLVAYFKAKRMNNVALRNVIGKT